MPETPDPQAPDLPEAADTTSIYHHTQGPETIDVTRGGHLRVLTEHGGVRASIPPDPVPLARAILAGAGSTARVVEGGHPAAGVACEDADRHWSDYCDQLAARAHRAGAEHEGDCQDGCDAHSGSEHPGEQPALDLDAIRERARLESELHGVPGYEGQSPYTGGMPGTCHCGGDWPCVQHELAHNDIPALVAEVERLHGELSEATTAHGMAEGSRQAALRLVDRLRRERDERLTLEESSRLARQADRYRAAWHSARRRARQRRDVLDATCRERDQLGIALGQVRVERDRWKGEALRAQEDAAVYRERLRAVRPAIIALQADPPPEWREDPDSEAWRVRERTLTQALYVLQRLGTHTDEGDPGYLGDVVDEEEHDRYGTSGPGDDILTGPGEDPGPRLSEIRRVMHALGFTLSYEVHSADDAHAPAPGPGADIADLRRTIGLLTLRQSEIETRLAAGARIGDADEEDLDARVTALEQSQHRDRWGPLETQMAALAGRVEALERAMAHTAGLVVGRLAARITDLERQQGGEVEW